MDDPAANDQVEAAHRMLNDLGRALGVAFVVQEVEGDGPVSVRALILYGTETFEVAVEGETEAEAIAEVGRRAIRLRGAGDDWIRRYGLGVG